MWFKWLWSWSQPSQPATTPAATPVGMADDSPDKGGGAATAEPPVKPKAKTKSAGKTKPKPPKRRDLPPWKVLLHNDNKNTFDHVILSIIELTPLKELDAIKATEEAHRTGVALLLVTHRERAELFVDQFQTKKLKVSIEPDE